MWFYKALHFLNQRSCVKHAVWDKAALRCPKCGDILALRYMTDKEVRVYVYHRYKSYTKDIISREDTKIVTCEGDLLGATNCAKFDEFLHDFKTRPFDVLPVSGDTGRFSSCPEGYDAGEFSGMDLELGDRIESGTPARKTEEGA